MKISSRLWNHTGILIQNYILLPRVEFSVTLPSKILMLVCSVGFSDKISASEEKLSCLKPAQIRLKGTNLIEKDPIAQTHQNSHKLAQQLDCRRRSFFEFCKPPLICSLNTRKVSRKHTSEVKTPVTPLKPLRPVPFSSHFPMFIFSSSKFRRARIFIVSFFRT